MGYIFWIFFPLVVVDLCWFQNSLSVTLVTSGKLFDWPGWMMGSPLSSVSEQGRARDLQRRWGKGWRAQHSPWGAPSCSPLVPRTQRAPVSAGEGGEWRQLGEEREAGWVRRLSLWHGPQESQQPPGPQQGPEWRPLCRAWSGPFTDPSGLGAITPAALADDQAPSHTTAAGCSPCHPVPARISNSGTVRKTEFCRRWFQGVNVRKKSCGSSTSYSFIFLPS